MGANKSKQVVSETARTVLSRRTVQETEKLNPQHLIPTEASAHQNRTETSNHNNIGGAVAYSSAANADMDPELVKQIAKWSFVREKNKRTKV